MKTIILPLDKRKRAYYNASIPEKGDGFHAYFQKQQQNDGDVHVRHAHDASCPGGLALCFLYLTDAVFDSGSETKVGFPDPFFCDTQKGTVER